MIAVNVHVCCRKRGSDILRLLHVSISEVLRAALRRVPGGYLCREQEGDLKYMLAFVDEQVHEQIMMVHE